MNPNISHNLPSNGSRHVSSISSRLSLVTLIATLGVFPLLSTLGSQTAIAQNAPHASDAEIFSSLGGDNSDAAIAKLIPVGYQAFQRGGKFLRDDRDNVILLPVGVAFSDVSQRSAINAQGNWAAVFLVHAKHIDSSYTSYVGARGTTGGQGWGLQRGNEASASIQTVQCVGEFPADHPINKNCIQTPVPGVSASPTNQSPTQSLPPLALCADPANANSPLCAAPPAMPSFP